METKKPQSETKTRNKVETKKSATSETRPETKRTPILTRTRHLNCLSAYVDLKPQFLGWNKIETKWKQEPKVGKTK